MTKLGILPIGLDAIIHVYGNPDEDGDHSFDATWFAENVITFKLPFAMRPHWDLQGRTGKRITRLQMHYLVGPTIVDALKEIRDYKGHDYLRDNTFDVTAGTFCFREMKGTYGGVSLLSVHSWAIAIDLNPHLAPYDRQAYDLGTYVHGQPTFIVDAFEKRGLVSLPWDRMHFQACDKPWPLEWETGR